MDFLNEEKIHIYLSYVMILGIIILCFLSFSLFKKINHVNKDTQEEYQEIEETREENEIKEAIIPVEEKEITVKVDIKGAVKKPGVYEVNKNAVIQDVITLAGGVNGTGSTKFINLAMQVQNQMVIRILTTAELKELETPIKETCDCKTVDTSSCKDAVVIIPNETDTKKEETTNKEENTEQKEKEEKKEELISINTATINELTTLSGVGESKAKAIVEYREKNGPFKALEEIKNVSGIGESVYNKIKDHIKL